MYEILKTLLPLFKYTVICTLCIVLFVIDLLASIRFSLKYPNLYHGTQWWYEWLCDELQWRKVNYYDTHCMDTKMHWFTQLYAIYQLFWVQYTKRKTENAKLQEWVSLVTYLSLDTRLEVKGVAVLKLLCESCLLFSECTEGKAQLVKVQINKIQAFSPYEPQKKNKPNNNKNPVLIISTIFLTVKGHFLLCILPGFYSVYFLASQTRNSVLLPLENCTTA